MNDLIATIEDVIEKLNLLSSQEEFPLYGELKNKYKKALLLIQQNEPNNKVISELAFTTRMFQEAPPKNKDLGLEILIKMDRVYKFLK
jgi:hypothetical protein